MLSWATATDDDAGTVQTLRIMRALTDQAIRDPSVVRLARRIVADAGRDQRRQLQAIYEWVARHVRFVRDPVTYDLVVSPLRLLSDIADRGWTQEDCESMASLVAALAESVGLQTRFHVISPLRPTSERDHRFTHVWAEALAGTQWIALDPALPSPRFDKRAPEGESEAIYERGTLMYVGRRGLGQWASLVGTALSTGLEVYKVSQQPKVVYQTGLPGAVALPGVTAVSAAAPARMDSGTATQYVTSLYRTILGREPDAPGLAAWVNTLVIGQLTPDAVRQGFINSPEYQTRQVTGRIPAGATPALSFVSAGGAVAPRAGGGIAGMDMNTMLLIGGGLLLYMMMGRGRR